MITKSLNVNLIKLCYAPDSTTRRKWFQYLNETFSAERFEAILAPFAKEIEVEILSKSKKNFAPLGSSVSLLIGEKTVHLARQLYHLDKSHMGVHTYYSFDDKSKAASFRIDFEVATCGETNPLVLVNPLLKIIPAEVVFLDFKLRGFADEPRKANNEASNGVDDGVGDEAGDGAGNGVGGSLEKSFPSFPSFSSARGFFAEEILLGYEWVETKMHQQKIYFGKLRKKEIPASLKSKVNEIFASF